jgi:hypothetical protein
MTMKIHHGIRLYAVDSRDVGTFGGKAPRATIKIYDGSCANSPRATISGRQVDGFRAVVPKERDKIEAFLRIYLPSNDPYRLPGGEG